MTKVQNIKQLICLQLLSTAKKTLAQALGMNCETIRLEVLVIEYYDLKFICNLVLVIWNFYCLIQEDY